MLHIVSELMVASALVSGFDLPTPTAGLLEELPAITHVGGSTQDASEPGEFSKFGRAAFGRATPGRAAFGQARPPSQLEDARGGTGVASDTRLGGEVASNTAQQIVTGANSIDSGSFSGSVGLPVVIQNSGANVLIQNATVINLQFK